MIQKTKHTIAKGAALSVASLFALSAILGAQEEQQTPLSSASDSVSGSVSSAPVASSSESSVASSGNPLTQLVRYGLSADQVKSLGRGKSNNLMKIFETQRTTGGIASVTNTMKVLNAGGANALTVLQNLADAVGSGGVLTALANLTQKVGEGTESLATLATLTVSGLNNYANASGDALFNALTSTAAKTAYSNLTTAQKDKLKALYSGSNLTAAEISSVLVNTVLMEQFPSILSDTTSGFTNALLAEAAKVGNVILTDVSVSANTSLASTDTNVLNYTEAFASGYNRALIALIAKYSNNENLVAGISTFAGTKGTISGTTTLSSLFTTGGDNANLLGLRKFGDTKIRTASGETLDFTLSQGEAMLGRDITIAGGTSGIEIDVTNTELKNAGTADQTSARVFAVAAIDDMNVSGKVTFKNTNTNARGTQNALVIGAADTLTVADNTEIINQGRILAVGAGKLVGTSGNAITGLKLQSNGSILVGSNDTITMVNPTFTVGDGKDDLIMYAKNTIDITNPTFTNFGSKSEIYMEAITINLTSVDFPNGSDVKLNSELGPINGKYPNFGSSVAGRVNFISGVKYAGNDVNSTANFDANGRRITIGTIGR